MSKEIKISGKINSWCLDDCCTIDLDQPIILDDSDTKPTISVTCKHEFACKRWYDYFTDPQSESES